MRIILKCFFLTFLLAACQPEPGPNPLETMGCGAGSSVQTANGLACVKATKDAGKTCRSSNQCEALCLAETRSCAPSVPYYGCHETLENGRGGQTVCVD